MKLVPFHANLGSDTNRKLNVATDKASPSPAKVKYVENNVSAIYQWLPLLSYRLHKQNNLERLEFYVIVILMEPKEMTLWRENTCFIWVLVEANRECVFYYTGYWKSSLNIQTHQYHKECFNWESNNSFGARNFINWSYLIILILDQSHPIETGFDSNLIKKQKSANYKYDSGDDYHCGVHRQVFICT